MRTVAVIPVKMNNERIPNKNTKLMCDGSPLIHRIMSTLKRCKEVDGIYVYCSNEKIKDYLIEGVEYLERPPIYDGADADINGMHFSITQKVEADIYVLAHATAPFLKPDSIDRGILEVKSGRYDSAISVTKMQDFIWKDGKTFNFNLDKIPRTQDLEPLWVETTGIDIFTKEVMELYHRRTGNKPYLLEVSKIEAVDIDDPIDFEIADAIYESIILKKG